MQPVKPALYICSTYYHVYVTLLKCMVLHQAIDLVICDDLPTAEQLSQRLKHSGLFGQVWMVEQSKLPRQWGKNLIDWIFFQKKRRLKAISPLLPFSVWDYEDVYIFHDGTPLGMHLIDAKKPYHLIEDSLNFYQRFEETPQAAFLRRHTLKYKLRQLMGWGYFSLGHSPYTLDVEVNENKALQLSGPPIVEQNREKLQKQLHPEQKEQLLSLFDVPVLTIPQGWTALILTEPLYQDGVCESPGKQYSIYEKIENDLRKQGYYTIIKPHPRDTVEYETLEIPILNRAFPVELLTYLLDGKLACVAAVSSSAIEAVPAQIRKKYSHFICSN